MSRLCILCHFFRNIAPYWSMRTFKLHLCLTNYMTVTIDDRKVVKG